MAICEHREILPVELKGDGKGGGRGVEDGRCCRLTGSSGGAMEAAAGAAAAPSGCWKRTKMHVIIRCDSIQQCTLHD